MGTKTVKSKNKRSQGGGSSRPAKIAKTTAKSTSASSRQPSVTAGTSPSSSTRRRRSASVEEVPDEDTLSVRSVNTVSDDEEPEPESAEDELGECFARTVYNVVAYL